MKGEGPQSIAPALDPTQPPPVAQLSTLNAQPDPDRPVVFLNHALLQERRTALISAAVTGKIDVRHRQTPAVEAAIGT